MPVDLENKKRLNREYYLRNKALVAERARKREREMQEYVWTQKRVPCMDCKIQYEPWVMQFDHRPDEEKVGDIGTLIKNGSWDKLLAEIEKCDVVCANCHCMRTATRAGWVPQGKFIYQKI